VPRKPGQRAESGKSTEPRWRFDDPHNPRGLVVMMDGYLESLAVRGFSPWLQKTVRPMLSGFLVWCQERAVTRAIDVTKPMIEAYQRHLFHLRKADGQPLSLRTQSWQLCHVRQFFRWMARQNYILANPAADLELPKTPQTIPRDVLSVDEVERIVAIPDLSTPFGTRDRAILETFYSTGIRRSELVHLRLHDLDFDRGTLLVREGKGRKDRMVPIGERALAWIRKYLADVRPGLVGASDDGTLFLSYKGGPIAPDVLTREIRRYILAAGITKHGSVHIFRHTAATAMLENGADIRYIQQMLGHAKLDTTEVYTHITIGKLKEIHSATHPGAKLDPREGPERLDDEERSEAPAAGAPEATEPTEDATEPVDSESRP